MTRSPLENNDAEGERRGGVLPVAPHSPPEEVQQRRFLRILEVLAGRRGGAWSDRGNE